MDSEWYESVSLWRCNQVIVVIATLLIMRHMMSWNSIEVFMLLSSSSYSSSINALGYGVCIFFFFFHSIEHGYYHRKIKRKRKILLVVTEEDLDREPAVIADLEAILQVVQLGHLVVSQVPAIEVKVAVNASLVDRLGDDTPALLHTPDQQHLLRALALLLGQLQQSRVLVERRVGRSKARVASAVDALGGVVGNELGRGVVGVQFDLVDGRNDLAARVVQENLQVLDAKVGDTNVPNLAGSRQLLHFLPVLWLVSWHDTSRQRKLTRS